MRGEDGGALSGSNIKVSMQYIIFSLMLQVPSEKGSSLNSFLRLTLRVP